MLTYRIGVADVTLVECVSAVRANRHAQVHYWCSLFSILDLQWSAHCDTLQAEIDRLRQERVTAEELQHKADDSARLSAAVCVCVSVCVCVCVCVCVPRVWGLLLHFTKAIN